MCLDNFFKCWKFTEEVSATVGDEHSYSSLNFSFLTSLLLHWMAQHGTEWHLNTSKGKLRMDMN